MKSPLNNSNPRPVFPIKNCPLTDPDLSRNRLIGGTGPNPVPAPQLDTEAREPDSTVFLNVGGKRFEVLWHTLGQFPGSRLSRHVLYIFGRYIFVLYFLS